MCESIWQNKSDGCFFHDSGAHDLTFTTELLYIFVNVQKFDDFGVAREVHFAHIIGANQSRQLAWTFYGHVVIEHLDLDIGSSDVVVTVSDGIDNQLSPAELREFRDGNEQAVFPKK